MAEGTILKGSKSGDRRTKETRLVEERRELVTFCKMSVIILSSLETITDHAKGKISAYSDLLKMMGENGTEAKP